MTGAYQDDVQEDKVRFILDSGALDHITNSYTKGNNGVTSDLGVQGLLEDVLFCPDAPYNLLSVLKMQRDGYTIIFDQQGSQVCKGDKTVMKVGQPDSLKLKIDGSIPLPSFDRESYSEPASGNEEFRASRVKDYSKEWSQPVENESDRDSADTPLAGLGESSVEKAELDRDIDVLLEELNGYNKTAEVHFVISLRNATRKTKKRASGQTRGASVTVPADTTFTYGSPEGRSSPTPSLRIAKKPDENAKPHKVKDDNKIQTFSQHVYYQALKAFKQMKRSSDAFTQEKIDSLIDIYKEKFSDFVRKTRHTDIRTGQGTQNVILHTIDTSNLIMKRLLNFLRNEKLASGASALREGSDAQFQKEVNMLRTTEFEHACKMFGICRTSQGFRAELQYIISTILSMPDVKILQANDAITETLKTCDLDFFITSNPLMRRVKRAIKSMEKTDAETLRGNLQMLYGVISKSHLPLVVEKSNTYGKMAVDRTVLFRGVLDALDEALPTSEANKSEWNDLRGRLQRWRDGASQDLQDGFQALFNNVKRGLENYDGVDKARDMIHDIVQSILDEE